MTFTVASLSKCPRNQSNLLPGKQYCIISSNIIKDLKDKRFLPLLRAQEQNVSKRMASSFANLFYLLSGKPYLALPACPTVI